MARGAYAKGKWALGECARSGRKMLLRNMIADGYYPNLIVDPHWYEPKHPQEALPSLKDPVTLFRPAPDRDQSGAVIRLGGCTKPEDEGGGFGKPVGGAFAPAQVKTGYELGNVNFLITPPALSQFEPTGSWVMSVDNFLVFSKDGKNWGRDDFIASTSWNTNFRWEEGQGTIVLLASFVVADSFKLATPETPSWIGSSGGSGLGQTLWIAFGPAGWVTRTTGQLRTSSDAITWTDEDASIPANWFSINGGQFKFSPTAGLYMALGSTFSAGFLDQYFTSSNRVSWTQRTFPANWTANGQGGAVDWLVDNGSILLCGLRTSGDIYSSTDGINWTLRHTGSALLTGLAFNPIEGAFYAVFSDTNPNNLKRSTDGITWAAVSPNDLNSIIQDGQIACDTGKNLMWVARTSNSSIFRTIDGAVSDDGGVTWFPRWSRGGQWHGFVPFNIGVDISDVLTISVDPINVSDARSTPTLAFARIINRSDNTIDEQTSLGGIVEIGTWSVEGLDGLNPSGREVRLDQLTGPALNFGTATVNAWIAASSQRLWGYSTTLGSITGTFTLRYRDSITLVESNAVPVSLTATST